MAFDWMLTTSAAATALPIAGAILLALTALDLRRRQDRPSIFMASCPTTTFLFDGDILVDATPAARAMIAGGRNQADNDPDTALRRMIAGLEPIFPGLGARLKDLEAEGRLVLRSGSRIDPPLVLEAEWLNGLTRLAVASGAQGAATQRSRAQEMFPDHMDGAAESVLRDENAAMRQILGEAPLPIWRETIERQVIWANAAYIRLATTLIGRDRHIDWPLPIIFRNEEGNDRCRLILGDDESWFQIIRLSEGDESLCYAHPVSQLVRAETDLQQFTQTLTRTFAELSVGLAIFDDKRRLQIFNPALMDLTGLPIEFLISKPGLTLVLDALRERRMIPEQKDYQDWRRRVAAMDQAATAGIFHEVWTLPEGQTYEVTGRPHPNGGVAFVIEDVSSEIQRTRSDRAELELDQAVFDAMAEAIVIFAQNGAIIRSNRAARLLWGEEAPAASSDRPGAPDAIRRWRQQTSPTPFWDDLAAFTGSFDRNPPQDGTIHLIDGREYGYRVARLPQGASLVTFRATGAYNPVTAEIPGV